MARRIILHLFCLIVVFSYEGISAAPFFATGVKIGEVTDSSAVIWARLTAAATRLDPGTGTTATTLKGATPGIDGSMQIRYGTAQDLSSANSTGWVAVTSSTDFAKSIPISGLPPASTIYFRVYAKSAAGVAGDSLSGQFRTAARPDTRQNVTFCVVTGNMFKRLDNKTLGPNTFASMKSADPDFVVFTGDNVYYDNDSGVPTVPYATSIAFARYHWERMYSFPNSRNLLSSCVTYWEKDDHDIYYNDYYPGMPAESRMGSFTAAQGMVIVKEQTPVPDVPYRTFRWGKDIQFWFSEGREFRSKNTMNDGPNKTLLGATQKAWLKKSLLESNAKWRILVSPTPIIGPDRDDGSKTDNLANAGFKTEGDEMRKWFADNLKDNFFIVCGDRHWQYHSIEPITKVQEFACGPISDAWAVSTSSAPGLDKDYHKYYALTGGFFKGSLVGDDLTMAICDPDGKVRYSQKYTKTTAIKDLDLCSPVSTPTEISVCLTGGSLKIEPGRLYTGPFSVEIVNLSGKTLDTRSSQKGQPVFFNAAPFTGQVICVRLRTNRAFFSEKVVIPGR